jgi:thiol:disulfide interchange protein
METRGINTLGNVVVGGAKGRPAPGVIMPLINIVLTLIVLGVLLWLVNQFIPMAASIKSILNAVVVIVVVLWLLNVFGVLSSLGRVHIGG